MNRDVVELEERFQQLKTSRSALSAEMRTTATALRTSGQTPTVELDRSLNDYQGRHGQFRADLGITPEDSVQADESSWDLFTRRLTVLRQVSEATQRLQPVERLRMPVGFEATLERVRVAYREVTDRLLKSPWDESELTQAVREGRHPLCRLVSLADALHELTDEEWTTEMAAMQAAFGIAVSTALARGRITLSDSPVAH